MVHLEVVDCPLNGGAMVSIEMLESFGPFGLTGSLIIAAITCG